MDPRLGTAVIVVVGVPLVLVGYIYGTELLLRFAPEGVKSRLRPWLWLLPALLFLGVFLVYPTIGTLIRSLQDKVGTAFVGLDNYAWFFTSDEAIISLRNNVIWLVLLPFQFAIALYGGYFGAGIGILMLAGLGLMGLSDLYRTTGEHKYLLRK